ncbi:MAG: ECF transporter S component [Clostridia bacterium]
MSKVKKLVLAGVFLAFAMLLPLLTGQIQSFGKLLAPMHLPVLLAGFVLGPWYGLAIGFIAPILRSLIFTMPSLYPIAVAMAFELAAYGAFSGLLYRAFPRKTIYIYLSLVLSMLIGRAVYGTAMLLISGLAGAPYTFSMFMTAAFVESWIGIALQIVIIPPLVLLLKKAKLCDSL